MLLTVLVTGCAAGRAFRKGRDAARGRRLGRRRAALHERASRPTPTSAEYKIELERAMQNAAREHITRARDLEEKDQLDAALLEYQARDRDGSDATGSPRPRVAELERTIRERIEKIAAAAADRRAAAAGARRRASRSSTRRTATPLKFSFNNSSLRDILNFIGTTTGINIQYDAHVPGPSRTR